ncbi:MULTISPECIES: protein-methionine-sulfoxide reductase catalytic subunit MsrP [Methylomonas]|uniref:Protein-methionine-sulfoxide reductase catalytic subunit MsrP n=2 Tax=Methylomonas TaxID=416 RepID=A0A126T5Q8_9GAMM|nr:MULTISPECIES: protein-methionine-sulfoxide reductase catalytic subunit MsrP [Methylomonas]AMK77074.1 mononuclear molybdenum enzyme YedY [Methylomonas denitrificans]OAH97179.1 mononuclear molybdenum enzyme YedY [Methylomonas methanica]TCV82577.1 sulfoxide reductase catalytic subunit YedY [Methylomonas methanica]
MKTYKPQAIPASEITPQALFNARRKFMQMAGGVSLAAIWPQALWAADKLAEVKKSAYSSAEELTPLKDVSRYNNFYEFGTSKDEPAINVGSLRTRPWTVTIEGEVKKPKVFDIDDLLKMAPLEERVYRLRCVEAWSMVVPWVGYSLAELIKRVEPTGNAKFVEFVSLHDPEQMPGQKAAVLEWPYREGLRLDEAMHPLTLLTLGLYGEVLPNQNGAPVRIVTPWKYGFKSAKSIVKIRFVEQQPVTSWMKAGPGEYGFYANVNPEVDHPRWSQAKERRIGEFLKRKTLMFNGYADEVAALYTGMDLKRNF